MQMARSFEKFIPKNYIGSDLDVHGDKVYHIISFYAKSVIFGSTHLHHSMPRLLSLWLDYGSRVQINQQVRKVFKKRVDIFSKDEVMIKIIKNQHLLSGMQVFTLFWGLGLCTETRNK